MKVIVRFLGVAAALSFAFSVDAVTLGQRQTFDNPVSGWIIGAGPILGSSTDVPIVPSGGPAGAGDPYMLIESSGGSGPGSRLTAQNFGIWQGDYTAAGIGAISMDVRNFGPEDVYLRLLLLDFVGGVPTNGAFSTTDVHVQAGGNWQTITLPVSIGAVTNLLGSTATALSNVDELRIFHNPNPFFIPGQNPAVTATLGVDNITAVPEPGTWVLLAGGFILLSAPRVFRRFVS